jgi:diguanylate cyclase (GGDEF)-like protein
MAGRLAGLLYMGSGVLTILYLFLPTPMIISPMGVGLIAVIGILVGALALVLPWNRWPSWSTLFLLPVAYVLIGMGNVYGTVDASTFGIYFIVAFMWIGVAHPPGTSFWFVVPSAIAYVLPTFFRGPESEATAASAAIVIPVGLLVGEMLARVGRRERASRAHAQALARVARALASNLDRDQLLQTLVEQTKQALRAEHVVLYDTDESLVIKKVYGAGIEPEYRDLVSRFSGQSYPDVPAIRQLLGATTPIVVEDTSTDHGFPPEMVEPFGIKSFISAPIVVDDTILGVLACAESTRPRRDSSQEVALFATLAGEAGAAMRNAMLYERALEAARIDPLTGLSNRRAFHDQLDTEVERARRYGRPLSLVVLDIDRFKKANDAWGHQAGDRLLQRFAVLIEGKLRQGDSVYRVGGEEFAILLPETTAQGAVALAERLRRNVRRARLGLGHGEELELTVSAGVASYPEHGDGPEELFERADTALYEIKAAGGDAVSAPTSPTLEPPGVRLGLDVRSVIERRQLRPVYQPIVDLKTGRVLGYEAFSRLDPDVTTIPTTTLFSAAGPLGLVTALDKACQQVVVDGASELPERALLFLNACPAALDLPEFADDLARRVDEAGIDRSRVVVEITEHERSIEWPHLARRVLACRKRGFAVALDDVGGSESSDLQLMATIPFDYVKIDMSFVQRAHSSDGHRRVLAALHRVVDEVGAKAIAEGVETEGALMLVREIGFAGVQGYLFGLPCAAFVEPDPRFALPVLGADATGGLRDDPRNEG